MRFFKVAGHTDELIDLRALYKKGTEKYYSTSELKKSDPRDCSDSVATAEVKDFVNIKAVVPHPFPALPQDHKFWKGKYQKVHQEQPHARSSGVTSSPCNNNEGHPHIVNGAVI